MVYSFIYFFSLRFTVLLIWSSYLGFWSSLFGHLSNPFRSSFFYHLNQSQKTFLFLPQYQFKLCLATASLGVSGALKTDDKKLELWVNGRTEIYTLEAKNKQAKESFAAELRKVVIRQKEIQRSLDQRTTNAVQQQVNILKILITTSPNTPYFISRLIFFEKVQTLIEVCLKHKSVNAFKLILPLNIF